MIKKQFFLITLLFLTGYNSSFGQKTSIQPDPSIKTASLFLESEAIQDFYSPSDLTEISVTNAFTSQGISHVYFTQTKNGIPILEANAAVHLKNNIPFYSTNKFLRGLQELTEQNQLTLTIGEALNHLSTIKNYQHSNQIKILSKQNDPSSKMMIEHFDISIDPIPASLKYIQTIKGTLTLTWDIAIHEVQGEGFYNAFIDAQTGKLIKEISWVVECNFDHNHEQGCGHNENQENHSNLKSNGNLLPSTSNALIPNSYNVFPWPIESPNFGDRSIVTTPWLDNIHPDASPTGWHTIGETSYTTTRGNNVDAYEDRNNTDSPSADSTRANGGANLDFDFNWTEFGNQIDYKDAAVTNLFYWSNIIHDVMYHYGFDEASGNFQEINFTGEGAGGDYVRCEAQDGSGNCNANFGTPSDGGNPTMQMYLCDENSLDRDGDYDNGVIIHEYGHGISNRLTGGASNSGCLFGSEQMGEGWSDFFAMVMTMEPGDAGVDSRGMGTWLFGEGPNGPGIRPRPYSTDFAVNEMTYDFIGSGVSIPHGVGSVWATTLWEMTWALIEVYPFDADLYNGVGGNNIALNLVMEGLKLQPCGPGFVDGRDAILAADQALYSGANSCIIWEAFARRGLGFSASQGSVSSVSDGTEAFDLPPSCTIGLEKTSDKTEVSAGENIVYTLTATNATGEILTNIVFSDTLPVHTAFIEASGNGTLSGNVVTWTIPSIGIDGMQSVSFTVQVDALLEGDAPNFDDDMENGSSSWGINATGSTDWNLQTNNPNSGSYSWFANDGNTPGIANFSPILNLGLTSNSFLSFAHLYDTEATWDGGVVEISTNNGQNWEDLGNQMIQNGYNSTIYNSRPGFSGNSNGYLVTIIDLSSYSGKDVQIRFQMNCDQAVGGNGWFIDDVQIVNLGVYIPNKAMVSDGNITSRTILENPTVVLPQGDPLIGTVSGGNSMCFGDTTGTLMANITGGTSSYTYLWSNGENTQTINNLSAGTYFVTATDGVGEIVLFRQVEVDAEIQVNINSTPAINDNDGTAEAIVSGGNAPYTYLWTNGDTTNNISGLTPGTYAVEITDASLCMKEDSVEITSPFGSCLNRKITLTIQFDQWPEETSFALYDSERNIVASAGPFDPAVTSDGSQHLEYLCLEEGCYDFAAIDSYGDGICASNSNPQGYFELTDELNNLIVSACNIGFGDTLRFTLGDEMKVTNINDNGLGSLREVITNVCPNDTVYFDASLLDETILLTGTEIELSKAIAIKGLGMESLMISGNGNSRVFSIMNGVPVYIENVSIIESDPNLEGSAILNNGILTIKNVQVRE